MHDRSTNRTPVLSTSDGKRWCPARMCRPDAITNRFTRGTLGHVWLSLVPGAHSHLPVHCWRPLESSMSLTPDQASALGQLCAVTASGTTSARERDERLLRENGWDVQVNFPGDDGSLLVLIPPSGQSSRSSRCLPQRLLVPRTGPVRCSRWRSTTRLPPFDLPGLDDFQAVTDDSRGSLSGRLLLDWEHGE